MRRYRMFFWMAPAFALILSFAGNAVAGPNADAVVTLDIVTTDMTMNQTDDGVTSATVADGGTRIEIEVFVSGVTTALAAAGIEFDTLMVEDKGMMDDGMMDDGMMGTRVIPDIVKVTGETSDWDVGLPRGDHGRYWATLQSGPFTLPESGYLGTVILETQTDVTGMPFNLGVLGVGLVPVTGATDIDSLDVSVVLRFNVAVPVPPAVMIPAEAADGVAIPSGGESEPVRVTSEGFAAGATLTWHVEVTGEGATIDVLDDQGSMMEGDMFPSTSTFIDVKATGGAGGEVSVEVWAESESVETNRVTIMFDAAVPAVMIPDEAADGVAIPSGGESEPVRVTAEGFAAGATLTWHVEVTGEGATIDVLDDQGSMMEGDMFPSTSTFIDVKATGGAGGEVSVEVWAESESVETNRVTIMFDAAVPGAPSVMIPDEAADGVAIPSGGESEPVRVTAEGFAAGATLTWHVETTGTGATIEVVDDQMMMMEGNLFASTSTFIDVKATDAGGDVSVEVWAHSGSVETNRVTIMFNAAVPAVMIPAEAADGVAIPQGGESEPVRVTAEGFAAGATLTWHVETTGTGAMIEVVDDQMMMMEGNLFASTSTFIDVKATDAGGGVSVEVWAESGDVETDRVTIMFDAAVPAVMIPDEAADGVAVPSGGESDPVRVTAEGFAAGATLTWHVEVTGTGATIKVLDDQMNTMSGNLFPSTSTFIDVKATGGAGGDVSVEVWAESGSVETNRVTIMFNAAVPAVMIPAEAADGVAIPQQGGESDPVRVTAEGFAAGATLTWHVETTGTGATIEVVDDQGDMMEGDMFPSTSTFIDVKATDAEGDVSVEVWAESGSVETDRVTIMFNAAVPAVMIPAEAADGVAIPSGGESDPVRVTAEGFAAGATLTWHVETTGTGATIEVVDDQGDMMEGNLLASTSTFIDVKAIDAGGDVSAEVWAESGSVGTDRVTIMFNAAVPAVMIPAEAADGVTIPSGGESDPVRVTAEGFAAGATLTWHVETTGTGATIEVVDDQGDMMSGNLFPSTSTFIDVKATDAGGGVSVEVWAESDSVETDRVTIMFNAAVPPAVMIPAEAADGVAIPQGGESEPVRVTAEGFAEGATLTWHVEVTGTGATIDVLDDQGDMMPGDMFPSTSTFIDVKATDDAGGDVSAEVWAESDSVETNRVTIMFNAAVAAVMIPAEAIGGVAIPQGGESDPVRVTAEGFAEGATLTWHVEVTGTGATIDVLDDQGDMMPGDMFPSTSTFLDVKATDAGGDASVEVWAESDSVETNRVTIMFSRQQPVELASFGGELVDDRVVLNWTTASQTNNAGWRVLRSVDGETYEQVGEFVKGAGTSDALRDYVFRDGELPSAEQVFYVLEQIDLDGTVRRSDRVEMLLGARFLASPTEFSVVAYPNPFNPSTTLAYELPSDEMVSIVIYDALGQVVRTLVSTQRSAGRYTVQWDARDSQGHSVGSGVYIAKIEAGSFSASQKMLLLK